MNTVDYRSIKVRIRVNTVDYQFVKVSYLGEHCKVYRFVEHLIIRNQNPDKSTKINLIPNVQRNYINILNTHT